MYARHVRAAAALTALTVLSFSSLKAQEPSQATAVTPEPGVQIPAPAAENPAPVGEVQIPAPAVEAQVAPAAEIPTAVEAPAPVPAPVGEAPVGPVEVVEESATEATVNPLDELGWLVGDWHDEDEEAQVETRYQWTKNGAFLLHSFRVSTQEGEPLSGMQIIGWDPIRQTVRSWIYDSAGGFGESTWKKEGDRWSIKTNFTTVDGDKATSTNMITYVNDDEYTWRSVNREVGGMILPDINETTVVRVSGSVDAEPMAEEGTETTSPAPTDSSVTPTSNLVAPAKSFP